VRLKLDRLRIALCCLISALLLNAVAVSQVASVQANVANNATGYRDGSPLTFAKQLKGDLLLVHGTGDDNCHYQGVELLINELVAQNKPFTVMPYPGRSHSISEGTNTARHFYALLATYLSEHLGGKP